MCIRDSLKVIFSQRGGHYYGQTKAYWELLKRQSAGGTTHLQKWEVKHEVLRYSLVDYVPHVNVAGLQLADAVASAFYQAVDVLDVQHDTSSAQALKSKMGRRAGVIADYGVVLQPTPPWKAKLTEEQKQIFSFYGFEF